MRIGSLPEDAHLGTVKRNSGIFVPSEHLDTPGYDNLCRLDFLLTNLICYIGAAAFIAAAAKHLPPSDVWCILYPSLKHFLRSDVRDIDEQNLLLALKPPVGPVLWAVARS